MTQEISRTFDTARAAVIVHLKDAFGNISVHTIHLLHEHHCDKCGRQSLKDLEGRVDVKGTIEQLKSDIDAMNQKLRERMLEAEWDES